jgi:hypothetical protein
LLCNRYVKFSARLLSRIDTLGVDNSARFVDSEREANRKSLLGVITDQ